MKEALLRGSHLPASDKLKQKLSEYFIKYRLGDYTARDKIIMCNIKLVLNEIFRKFFNSTYDKQELLSVGIIGLIKSVDTFDITKNYQFVK